ncbi:helix-turn-helix domain-containing protein [Nonomuraea sp. NPDC048901]|uniref:helix-turn-helix domain-containing protein n=1 Tax=Nonomuraea sp. NPDC048901 TaxID=3155627 RepID=UPI0033D7C3F9
MSETWTIRELAERAADALRAHAQPHAQPLNGRVRDVPGERLIRWYTTIGLVDPPLTRRGRIAQYGRRHLLQLVAIKRLQAAGRSIAEIQTALTGATDTTLERTAHPGWSTLDEDVAATGAVLDATTTGTTAPQGEAAQDAADLTEGETGLTEGETPEAAALPDGSATRSGSPRGRFWAAHPADATGPALPHPPPTDAPPSTGIADVPLPADVLRPADTPPTDGAGRPAHLPRPRGHGALVRGIRLTDGVTLVLDGAGRTPAEDDIQAVLTAAAPLLALLEERKLA